MGWRIRAVSGAAALVCIAGVVQGQTAPPQTIIRPDWLRKPSAQDMARVYPIEAYKKGVEGKVTIRCVVAVSGALRACKVASEEPKGVGFGEAALVMSSQFLMKPMFVDGVGREGIVNVPIKFNGVSGPPSMSTSASTKTFVAVPWEAAPSLDQVAAAYPAEARATGLAGRVALDCVFGTGGSLSSCDVVGEAPARKGFGKAAKSLMPHFRGPATDSAGKTTRGYHGRLNVVFSPDLLKDGEREIMISRWRKVPTVAELKAAVTEQPETAGKSNGKAAIKCMVDASGRLVRCEVLNQEPAGFGPAALALAPKFSTSLWSDDGEPLTGGMTRLELKFGPGPARSEASASR